MTEYEAKQIEAMRKDIAKLSESVRSLDISMATLSTRLDPETLNDRIDNRILIGLREARSDQQNSAGLWIAGGSALFLLIINIATLVAAGVI